MRFFRVRPKFKLLILVLIWLGYVFVLNMFRLSQNFQKYPYAKTKDNFNPKRENETIILHWTKYLDDPPPLATWDKQLTKCSSNCRIVSDRRYLTISDAVVFHGHDLKENDMPVQRNKSQVWIFLEQIPPDDITDVDLTKFSNIFNWTMTYRLDSDVVLGYGSMRPALQIEVPPEMVKSIKENVLNKTKLVAYVSHNCDTSSKLEEYVSLLAQYIPVDVFGNCGKFSCDEDDKANDCLSEIGRDYKFYLSFEQSLCKDYITEVFYNPLQYTIVPVVYGGADYAARAPLNSYINIKDFSSSKMLAKYLRHLDKNEKDYMEYFEWKGKFRYEPDTGWCDLCNILEQRKERSVEKVYSNLWQWWFKQGDDRSEQINACVDPSYDIF